MSGAVLGRSAENPTGSVPGTTKDCVTDLELVERAQRGDSDAFGILVERHHRAALRAAVAAWERRTTPTMRSRKPGSRRVTGWRASAATPRSGPGSWRSSGTRPPIAGAASALGSGG
jgi:hypothetical protein